MRLVDTHRASSSRKSSFSKARSKIRIALGRAAWTSRTYNIAPPFGIWSGYFVQRIRSQRGSAERFEDKIVITFTLNVSLQPLLLAGGIGRGIANPAFDIILIAQPDNERRIRHLNRAQTHTEAFRM